MSSITLDRTQATEDEVKSAMRCIVVFQEVASLMRGGKKRWSSKLGQENILRPFCRNYLYHKKPTVLILVFITLEDH